MTNHMGRQIGNYHLLRLLGKGGFAEVYLGKHIYLKTQAAIKVLRARFLENDAAMFLKEARLLASLQHPHVVHILEFAIEDTTPFLAMNYAANGCLSQRCPVGTQLPLDQVVSYVKVVASALQYAHDQKVIHRDVKPENLLLDKNEQILAQCYGSCYEV